MRLLSVNPETTGRGGGFAGRACDGLAGGGAAMRARRLAAIWLLVSAAAAAAGPPDAAGYKVVRKVEVGGEGGWDYLLVDAAARRLYVPRSTRVAVFDADTF